MEKERLGVIFGGMSTENEVSVVSANSVIKNLDRENMRYILFILIKMEFGMNIVTYKKKEN